MTASVVVLSVSSALIASVAFGLALALRPRVAHDLRAALWCLAPIPPLLAALVAMLAAGASLVVPPLTAAMAVCLAGSATLVPTSGSKFARFERQFWAYVHHTQRSEPAEG